MFPTVPKSLQKDLNLPPPPNDTYKGFRMTMRIMLYSILWKVQVVKKGRFLRENPGSWEPEIYAKNPSTTSWGSVENSGRFTRKKHWFRANVRICVFITSSYPQHVRFIPFSSGFEIVVPQFSSRLGRNLWPRRKGWFQSFPVNQCLMVQPMVSMVQPNNVVKTRINHPPNHHK
jgi:hypothetical protein